MSLSSASPTAGATLNSAPIQALSSQNPNSLQALTPSPGTLTPIIMDSGVLSQGQTGTIVSLPQTFCFPNAGFNAGNLSSGITALPPTSHPVGSSAQLGALSMGSVFSINQSVLAPQFMHSLSLPQQQALTMSLNQPSPQQPTQNLQPITLGQNSGPVGAPTSTIPLNQMVGTSMGAPGLGFVNQTLFTMPNPSGGQPQFIPQPFGQIPIMLGGQPPVLTNNPNSLTSQGLATSSISQSATLLVASSQSVTIPSTPQNSSYAKPALVTSSSTLSTGPKSVCSETPAATPKLLPDTTNSVTCTEKQESVTATSTESIVSSTTGAPAITSQPSSLPVTMVTPSATYQADEAPICATNFPAKVSCLEDSLEIPPQTNNNAGCARMKFTPIEPDTQSSLDHKRKNQLLLEEEFDDNEDSDNEDEEDQDSSISGPLEQDERESPSNLSVADVKIEPFERNSGDEGRRSLSPSNCCGDLRKADTQGDLADIEDLEDTEFIWEDYLRETGASAVPPTAFKHVEWSLQSGFCKGMKLEAPTKNNPNTYWVATVVMTCGPLLRLRYEGYQDNSSADFWSDPMTSDIHPVGWCERNGKALYPPDYVKEKCPSWNDLLKRSLENAVLAPAYLLDKTTGATPVDQIQEGMRLEIQNIAQPNHVWIVRILENVGGRLCLRYEGIDNSASDFWLFYLDEHLHPLGWCKTVDYDYVIPEEVKAGSEISEEALMQMVDSVVSNVGSQRLLTDIFQDQRPIKRHRFKVGMKLETVDPDSLTNICPATVTEVIDDKYFIVQVDCTSQLQELDSQKICCHGGSFNIFPINWAARMGIKLSVPQGWEGQDFNWDQYLEMCQANAAPDDLFNMENEEHEFECGMKLEVVNPHQPHQICAATITKVVGPLLWVHLDSSRKVMDSHVESVHSLNIFPISWCFGNCFQLQPPRKSFGSSSKKRIAVVQPEMAVERKDLGTFFGGNERELYGGPQIHFNHRCFSGPYLSKGRIAELPRTVGPGPVSLVMKEVMSKLIQTAYKSSRVLRELQLDGRSDPNMTQHMLKAKYKGKSYKAVVEICKSVNQLDEFCRNLCIKMECCPNLVSPHLITGDCPENCSQLTKTKYTYYYGKRKKKIGRPPGGHSNLENGQKKPGKRKKRKKIGLMAKRSTRPTMDEPVMDNMDDDKASVCSDTRTVDSTSTTGSKEKGEGGKLRHSSSAASKRRYTHHIPPPSEIRTRGAKLPKYSFEKRTHKKIMIGEVEQRSLGIKKEMRASHSSQDILGSQESSFSMRPEMPVSLKSESPLKLEKNPLEWTVSDVSDFLMTTDCSDRDLLARLKTEEIDGQALLLLTLPSVQEYMGIKLGPAIKLCHLIERIKLAFYSHFAK